MKTNLGIFALLALGACQTSQVNRGSGGSSLSEERNYKASIAGQCHSTTDTFKTKHNYQEELGVQYAEPVLALLGDDKNPIMRDHKLANENVVESYSADMIICNDRDSLPIVIQKFSETRYLQYQPSENEGFKDFQLKRFRNICLELVNRSIGHRWPDGNERFAAMNVVVNMMRDPHQVGNFVSQVSWTLVSEKPAHVEQPRNHREPDYNLPRVEDKPTTYTPPANSGYDAPSRPSRSSDSGYSAPSRPSSTYRRPSSTGSSYNRPSSSYGRGSSNSGYGSSSGSDSSYRRSGSSSPY